MNIRVFNQRFLEPGSQLLMILGIIFLCQPWIELLHQYSVTIMLIGLVGFNFAVHIPPPETTVIDEAEANPAAPGGPHG